MWFGRNTKELDSFPPEKWKLLLFIIVSFIHKKELDFAKYNYNFLKKDINTLFRPTQKNS